MVEIFPENERFFFDKCEQPCASVQSGETVVFHCKDCYADQIITDGQDFLTLDMQRNNPITGPLRIEGAQPGDILQIDILGITTADFGCMCVRTGSGVYEVPGCHCRRFPISDGHVLFDGGIRIPVQPMIGVIGTAPAGKPVSTQTPGEHGGNMDIRVLGAGSTLYLPVAVPGALLSLGDLHAVQGDGETAICALEVSGSVHLRVTVRKSLQLETPFLETRDAFYTIASSESLDKCSVVASRKMHRFVLERYDLDAAQAAMLLSLYANLKISQVVNPQNGCYMELPKAALKKPKEGFM